MTEPELLALLRALPLHPGADGLCDDAARIGDLVLTTDTLVEGVHYLPGDPAEDVAWKLVATNLSDLAAKGAAPEGAMLNLPLGDGAWDRAFLEGLGAALGVRLFLCFDELGQLIGCLDNPPCCQAYQHSCRVPPPR